MEFALVLPVLILILIAILDFGRALYAYSVVANCAREGARFAIIHPDDTPGITAVVENAAVGLDLSQLNITVSEPTTDTIQVYVQYGFELITPLVAQTLGSSELLLQIQSRATMYTGY